MAMNPMQIVQRWLRIEYETYDEALAAAKQLDALRGQLQGHEENLRELALEHALHALRDLAEQRPHGG